MSDIIKSIVIYSPSDNREIYFNKAVKRLPFWNADANIEQNMQTLLKITENSEDYEILSSLEHHDDDPFDSNSFTNLVDAL